MRSVAYRMYKMAVIFISTVLQPSLWKQYNLVSGLFNTINLDFTRKLI